MSDAGDRIASADSVFTIREEIRGSFLGTSDTGRPTIIIPTTGGRLPIERASGDVILSFREEGTIDVGARQLRCAAAIIECANTELVETFDVLAKDLALKLDAIALRPTPQAVSKMLARWEELLRGRRLLDQEAEIGLWGELWLLLQLPDLERGVAVWRGPLAEYVDFVGGGVGIECKTGRRRLEHFVSHEQVSRPLGELEAFVLSLWVDNDVVQGETLPDLIAKADARLADRREFEEKLLKANYSRGDAHKYTQRLRVLEPPLLFTIGSIPRVRGADPGVSHIRYMATLSEDSALNRAEALSTLMRVCSPPTSIQNPPQET